MKCPAPNCENALDFNDHKRRHFCVVHGDISTEFTHKQGLRDFYQKLTEEDRDFLLSCNIVIAMKGTIKA